MSLTILPARGEVRIWTIDRCWGCNRIRRPIPDGERRDGDRIKYREVLCNREDCEANAIANPRRR